MLYLPVISLYVAIVHRHSEITYANAYVRDVYLLQLTLVGGKSVPCHPAYHAVRTAPMFEVFAPLALELGLIIDPGKIRAHVDAVAKQNQKANTKGTMFNIVESDMACAVGD